jgi:hypothetical protein
MPAIEFFYFEDCPSHDRALALLQEVMAQQGMQEVPITVIRVETEEEAVRYGFYGSPTIRIDGVDIAPLPEGIPQPALACRAYRRADGRISPLPPRELIEAALQRGTLSAEAQAERRKSSWQHSSTATA